MEELSIYNFMKKLLDFVDQLQHKLWTKKQIKKINRLMKQRKQEEKY